MGRRRRFLLYSQSLTGTGHFVKTFEIARALDPFHEVCVVDGGRPIARRAALRSAFLDVPRIYRREGRIVPLEPGRSIDAVMARRREALLQAVERLRPDVLVIDQFPFFKWDLREEIVALIERARAAHPGVKVVCSTWELPRGTGLDPRAPSPALVLDTFRAHFDGLLIHADPRLIALEEHIPWAGAIPVPVRYSGYVSEKVDGRPGAGPPPPGGGRGLVIVSTGGASLPALLRQSLLAWQHLGAAPAARDWRLVVFLPPFQGRAGLEGVPVPEDGRVRLEPFSADFLRWMAAADVSISQAGYNTCTNVLETRVRAILVPNPATLDQVVRARRLAERGLARTLDAAGLAPDRLAAAIVEAFAGPPPVHDLDLEGAAKTRALLEEIAEDGRWSAA